MKPNNLLGIIFEVADRRTSTYETDNKKANDGI